MDLLDKPSNIFNDDESGYQADQGKYNVVVKKGQSRPSRLTGNNQKQQYTVLWTGNANGVMLPLFVIYKAKNLRSKWCLNGPKGASFDTSPSGSMETDNFTNWFKKIFRPIAEGPKIVFF